MYVRIMCTYMYTCNVYYTEGEREMERSRDEKDLEMIKRDSVCKCYATVSFSFVAVTLQPHTER